MFFEQIPMQQKKAHRGLKKYHLWRPKNTASTPTKLPSLLKSNGASLMPTDHLNMFLLGKFNFLLVNVLLFLVIKLIIHNNYGKSYEINVVYIKILEYLKKVELYF